MSKREKIIVALMLITVVYGAYSFFWAPAMKKAQEGAAGKGNGTLDAMVAEIADALNGRDPTKSGGYVLAQAEADWDADPFLDREIRFDDGLDAPAFDPDAASAGFAYSGFLKMGDRDLAVINGMEYAVGEGVEGSEFVVRQITPSRVVLGTLDDRNSFVLLLDETE